MRVDRGRVAVIAAALSAPLVSAMAVAWRGWTPIGEFAQAEFRIRGFWSAPPQLGAVGRLAVDGVATQHPGPLAWWAMYPLYSVAGGGGRGLTLATAGLALAWVTLAVLIAARHGGTSLAIALTIAWLAAQQAIGPRLVTEPWNPWFAVPPFLCLIISTWAVFQGSKRALIVTVLAASFAVQAHLGYLPFALSCCAGALWRVAYSARSESADDARPSDHRWGWIAGAVTCGAVAWALPIWDQLTHAPGNLAQIVRAFGEPGDPAAGWGTATRVMLSTLDIRGPWLLDPSLPPDELNVGLGTLAFLGLWAASVTWARRGKDRRAMHMHALLGMLVGVGFLTTTRILGPVHDYLVPWWSILASTIAATCGWTAWRGTAAWRSERQPPRWRQCGWALLAIAVVAAVGAGGSPPSPGGRLAESTHDLAVQLAPVRAGAESFEVNWEDPQAFGAIGYGLVADLDRRGIPVAGPEFFRPALTDRLVGTPTDRADVSLVVVTGRRIDAWDGWSGAERVAFTDPRSSDERDRSERERRALQRSLRAIGGDVLAGQLDSNVFVTRSDPRLSGKLRDRIDQWSELGLPTAVYVIEPGTTGPPA